MKYGCIGEKLGHSFSREIHTRLADYTYELLELSPDGVEAFLQKKEFSAINVTIPYKQTVMPYLDEIDPFAEEIGAVNTVVNRDGRLYGYNTDFFGMSALLKRAEISLEGKKVLILGSGGTARTARAVARELKAREIYVVSRQGKEGISYEEARTRHADAEILINTTPCGMYPNLYTVPLDLADYPRLEGVMDAVYNPLCTELVMRAKERGIPAVCGLFMLVAQAAYAVEHFLNTVVPAEKTVAVYRELRAQKQNVVLIGMPGSGKTTVGKQLAEQLGRKFVDTDALIAERFGKTPAELICAEGEAAFRDKETAVIRDLAPESGLVIATGGGAVLRKENVRDLRRNGRIYFIDRPLEEIVPTPDRPLSVDREQLEKRYRERYDIYCASADHIIEAASVAEEVCKEIIEDLNV